MCDNNSVRGLRSHVQTLRLHKSILGFPNHCQDEYSNHLLHPPADWFLKPVRLNTADLFEKGVRSLPREHPVMSDSQTSNSPSLNISV